MDNKKAKLLKDMQDCMHRLITSYLLKKLINNPEGMEIALESIRKSEKYIDDVGCCPYVRIEELPEMWENFIKLLVAKPELFVKLARELEYIAGARY